MDQVALKAHFFAVADTSTIPVIIYNMPQNTGIDMSAEIIIAISGHPNIIGLKDSGGNMEKMRTIIALSNPDFQVLAGSAGFLLPALQLGAIGGILALANIAPAVCLKIVELFRENKLDEATALQRDIVELNAAVTRQWGVPALKATLDHLGLYGGIARKPLLKVSDENRERVLNLLDALQNTPI